MSSIDRPIGVKVRVAAVGDNCIDVLQPPINRKLVGGNALNVAVQMARLGGDAAYFGAVSSDENGDLVRASLQANGLSDEHLTVRPGRTAHTDIEVAASGERHIGFEDFGVCAGYTPSSDQVALLPAMDHVHIGWLDDGGALRRALVAAGVSVSQDISVNADPADLGVDGLSIAFCSQPGPADQAAGTAAALLRAGAKAVVVTRGADGSSAFFAGRTYDIGAVEVSTVDTTGAGDSYVAAFVLAHLAGADPARAGELAAAHAALTCRHLGGFSQA